MYLKEIEYRTLQQARDVLQGRIEHSCKTKNDSNIISFTHGNGIRYPGYLDNYSLPYKMFHKYDFLKHNEVLENELRKYCEQEDSEICLTLGASDGLQIYLRCWAKPSDCIIVTQGFYHSITTWAHYLQLPIRLLSIGELSSDLEKQQLIDVLNTASKQFNFVHLIITNPSISGNLYHQNILDFIKNNSPSNLNIIYDNVFYKTLNNNLNNCFNRRAFAKNEIGIFSLTKTHGLSAQPFGCIFGSHKILSRLKEYLEGHRGRFPKINSDVALLALTHSGDYLRINNAESKLRRDSILSRFSIEENLVKVVGKPVGAHSITILLPSCKKKKGIESLSIQHTYNLLNVYGIAVSPGITNGEPDGSIRINFADCGDDFHLKMETKKAFECGRKKMLKGINKIIHYANNCLIKNIYSNT